MSSESKGENNGTITDMDGHYSLMNVPRCYLTISILAIRPSTLLQKDKNTTKIALTEDSKMIDEVVVVGYGVQRKRDVYFISSVKAGRLRRFLLPTFVRH